MPLDVARRRLLVAGAALPWVASAMAADWTQVEAAARGQTVYFNAWAGSERINAYLQWAGAEIDKRHGVKLEHVKVSDTAEVVKRVRAEKQSGRLTLGSTDAVWINGENFLAMKREGLLFGPFAESLPSYAAVDTLGKPTTRIDFSEPVDGMEAPWGMAQLTYFADSKRVPQLPQSAAELVVFAERNPGRITYPKPPNFHGTTFLKQLLLEASTDRTPFHAPLVAEAFERMSAPLWAMLDTLHPVLWREGRQFPASNAVMRQMMADGELLMSLTFNPNEAANEIAAGRLPPSVVSWQPRAGSIGNTHFLAIAFNARAKPGAQVVINFLLSPLAQARKADIAIWGDPTVLALDRLSPAERALFAQTAMPGTVVQGAPTWPEPHASWVPAIEREWTRRYGQ
jgi:putative thiamine transport system substrate-binding protein